MSGCLVATAAGQSVAMAAREAAPAGQFVIQKYSQFVVSPGIP